MMGPTEGDRYPCLVSQRHRTCAGQCFYSLNTTQHNTKWISIPKISKSFAPPQMYYIRISLLYDFKTIIIIFLLISPLSSYSSVF